MEAYFVFQESESADRFIIELLDAGKIAHARRIVDKSEKVRIHVQGLIVWKRVSYNPAWSFHIDPASIDFFSVAIEVCDATMRYVEDNLSGMGSAFLPNGHWCPRSSKIVEELKTDALSLIR